MRLNEIRKDVVFSAVISNVSYTGREAGIRPTVFEETQSPEKVLGFLDRFLNPELSDCTADMFLSLHTEVGFVELIRQSDKVGRPLIEMPSLVGSNSSEVVLRWERAGSGVVGMGCEGFVRTLLLREFANPRSTVAAVEMGWVLGADKYSLTLSRSPGETYELWMQFTIP